MTDHYQVDPRLGGNEAYRDMVAACHERNMRVIQDVIFNHWGHNHWMVRELPDSLWLHQWQEFTLTNYNCNVMTDPHAVKAEIDQFNQGWFVRQMPDLAPDQDPLLADLLVQNALVVDFRGGGRRVSHRHLSLLRPSVHGAILRTHSGPTPRRLHVW